MAVLPGVVGLQLIVVLGMGHRFSVAATDDRKSSRSCGGPRSRRRTASMISCPTAAAAASCGPDLENPRFRSMRCFPWLYRVGWAL